MNELKEICNSFNIHAVEYEQAAIVQLEIGRRLCDRLRYFKIAPQTILDAGCGNGYFTDILTKNYLDARVIGVDLALLMLGEARFNYNIKHPICANFSQLPFADQSFDLIFANQAIHWAHSVPKLMQELYRVLAVGGTLVFSTLGPDTFIELKQAFSTIDNYYHINDFMDMHDLGDIMLKEGFTDPVVDMERLTIHYKSSQDVVRGLKAQGVRNMHKKRRAGLMGRAAWRKFHANYPQTPEGKCPLSYEVIYGHAWKTAVATDDTEFAISLDALRATLK